MGDVLCHSPPWDSLEPGTCYFKAQLAVYPFWLALLLLPHPHSRRWKPCWTPVGAGDPSLGLYVWVISALTHWTISSALLCGVQLYSLNLLSCINPPSSHFWIKINWKGVYEQSFKSMSFPYMGQGIPGSCLYVLACDLCTDRQQY